MASTTVFAQEKKAEAAQTNAKQAAFTWKTQLHDFGKIKMGTPVTHEFTFVNTGNAPLIITNVQASCGCTTPDWSKGLIMPGGEGFIKATYNAATVGQFTKTISVTANVEKGLEVLTIKGEVQPEVQ